MRQPHYHPYDCEEQPMNYTHLPHDPYAAAVMEALEADGMLDAEGSWTEYSSDNGVVMVMELVITLDEDRTTAAGWEYGATLLWNQVEGWQWGPGSKEGHLQRAEPLIVGCVVPEPADVVRAAAILLDGAPPAGRLPIAGAARPAAAGAVPPAIQELLDAGAEPGTEDYAPTEETLRQLAAYAVA
ncbi:hypothetical protein [Streptomyces sp. NPDC048659]|uniref:hypothetical protein n=1 Tax=Streptomyces sp. NPDC048659 TaxID=3155489 RepID=UPI00341EF90C